MLYLANLQMVISNSVMSDWTGLNNNNAMVEIQPKHSTLYISLYAH